MSNPASDHIVILGAMATGKTTIGEGLARELGLPFTDSDRQISERTGRDGAAIAAEAGVPALHELELEVFWEAMSSGQPQVVAAAASVIEDPEVRATLDLVRCIWLKADASTLGERLPASSHRRPLGEEEAARLASRSALYEACADVILDTTGLDVDHAVAVLAEQLIGGSPYE